MAGDDDREPAASQEEQQQHEGGESKAVGEEEDTGAEVAPIVRLDAIAVSTGEENEDALIDLKAKLYRFDKEGNQWKERGMGQVKLLKHKDTGKTRLVMRQNKTLKICANHTVLPSMSLQEHQGSDKTWVWHASDFAEGELKDELFCIRFGSAENAQSFKKAFQDAQNSGKEDASKGDAEAVGELLDGLKVGDQEDGKKKDEEGGKAKDTTKKEEESKPADEKKAE